MHATVMLADSIQVFLHAMQLIFYCIKALSMHICLALKYFHAICLNRFKKLENKFPFHFNSLWDFLLSTELLR